MNAHDIIIILSRLQKFMALVIAAHDYLHANEQNQDETYDAISTWLSDISTDTDTGNSICLSMRIDEIENLLP